MQHGPDGSVLDVGRKTRTIPPAIRRALQARDGRCQFPGCIARRCYAHHLVHWAHGGSTGIDNLTLLCRRHHRLIHEGGIGIRRDADGRVFFHRGNWTRINEAPAPPVWTGDPLAPAIRRLAELGIQIDAHSSPCWDGTPFNPGLVIDALLGHRPVVAKPHPPADFRPA
jgi:hypothetical protein